MPYVTYENYPNSHVTIHRAGCREIRKGGGTDPERGEYQSHATYAEAKAHAQTTGRPIIDCSKCKPTA